jgi:hypothetical protein
LNTDTKKTKAFQVNGANTDLSVEDFTACAEKIVESEVFDVPEYDITGIKSGELVTVTQEQFV